MAVQVDRFTIGELFPAFAVLPPKLSGGGAPTDDFSAILVSLDAAKECPKGVLQIDRHRAQDGAYAGAVRKPYVTQADYDAGAAYFTNTVLCVTAVEDPAVACPSVESPRTQTR